MLTHKCDLCNKKIDSRTAVKAGIGWDEKELCANCGKPVIKFLEKTKLIKKKRG